MLAEYLPVLLMLMMGIVAMISILKMVMDKDITAGYLGLALTFGSMFLLPLLPELEVILNLVSAGGMGLIGWGMKG